MRECSHGACHRLIPDNDYHRQCEHCREHCRELGKKRRERLKAQGLCSCGKPATRGTAICDTCRQQRGTYRTKTRKQRRVTKVKASVRLYPNTINVKKQFVKEIESVAKVKGMHRNDVMETLVKEHISTVKIW